MSWLPRVFFFSFFLDHLISVWTHGHVETNYLHDSASLTFIADMFVLAKTNLKNMRAVFGSYRTLAFTPVKLVGQMVDFTSSDTRLSYTLFMPFIHICSVCVRRKSHLGKMPKDFTWRVNKFPRANFPICTKKMKRRWFEITSTFGIQSDDEDERCSLSRFCFKITKLRNPADLRKYRYLI